jgi:hypothetical protein
VALGGGLIYLDPIASFRSSLMSLTGLLIGDDKGLRIEDDKTWRGTSV